MAQATPTVKVDFKSRVIAFDNGREAIAERDDWRSDTRTTARVLQHKGTYNVIVAARTFPAPEKRVTYYIRPKTYRGAPGFHVGSRGKGWNISIFVERREDAELIRDAYNAERDGFILPVERDALEAFAFGMVP